MSCAIFIRSDFFIPPKVFQKVKPVKINAVNRIIEDKLFDKIDMTKFKEYSKLKFIY